MRYIIVGGVAGGASTAARLRRLDEQAEIVMFEKGAYISYANCGLPYYIGDVINDRNKLFVQTAASFANRFNIDVRVLTEVTAVDAAAKIITAYNHSNKETYQLSYDKLVLAPGAAPVKPSLPGIDLSGIFTLRNVNDTDKIKSYINDNAIKKAVVVGAGFIGLEMAENLHHLGVQVSIVEMGKQILAPVDYTIAAIAQQHIRSKGIDLKLGISVKSFAKNGRTMMVQLSDNTIVDTDMVILSIGVKPDTALAAAAGLQLGNARGIYVNEYLQTSDPDIYAVGDAIEFANPVTGQIMPTYLAGPANKQGRICADNIVMGNKAKYHGAINTAIVKLFDMTIATAGTAAKHLSAAGVKHIVSTTKSGSHAGYYPGAQQMTVQIVFNPENGVLLGAQVAGFDGVDKRIDILSSYIQLKRTVYDLAEFEHAYAPPYSSAKDPINMAGFVADNILTDKVRFVYWNELHDKLKDDGFLLDVRTQKEFSTAAIPGAVNIPVDELRNRLDELPRDKTIYIYCEIGLRGYLAQRIIRQKGFDKVFNLSGGFALWKVCTAETQLLH